MIAPAHSSLAWQMAPSYQKPKRSSGPRQEFSYPKVREHHVWRPVQSFVVGALEPFSLQRRMQQGVRFPDQMDDVFFRNVAGLVLKQMIDANEQIGDRM